jgi:hypothetical protein
MQTRYFMHYCTIQSEFRRFLPFTDGSNSCPLDSKVLVSEGIVPRRVQLLHFAIQWFVKCLIGPDSIEDGDSVLFEIILHRGDIAVAPRPICLRIRVPADFNQWRLSRRNRVIPCLGMISSLSQPPWGTPFKVMNLSAQRSQIYSQISFSTKNPPFQINRTLLSVIVIGSKSFLFEPWVLRRPASQQPNCWQSFAWFSFPGLPLSSSD